MFRVFLTLIFSVIVILFCYCAGLAYAQPPHRSVLDNHKWFEQLYNPALKLSCCSVSDCHVLSDQQWRQTRAGYELRVGDKWIKVPEQALLIRMNNPTGGVVACYGTRYLDGVEDIVIYCFVRVVEI